VVLDVSGDQIRSISGIVNAGQADAPRAGRRPQIAAEVGDVSSGVCRVAACRCSGPVPAGRELVERAMSFAARHGRVCMRIILGDLISLDGAFSVPAVASCAARAGARAH
jgi:hypothetical protein